MQIRFVPYTDLSAIQDGAPSGQASHGSLRIHCLRQKACIRTKPGVCSLADGVAGIPAPNPGWVVATSLVSHLGERPSITACAASTCPKNEIRRSVR